MGQLGERDGVGGGVARIRGLREENFLLEGVRLRQQHPGFVFEIISPTSNISINVAEKRHLSEEAPLPCFMSLFYERLQM